jgi:ABC-2 type transport system ATP-binding protein
MSAAVSLARLTKRFGEARGISEVTIEVPAGRVFGFLGPNGAGKSTTIRLMMGLYRATSGSARVLGLDPWTQGVELRRRVGYLPGELSLFPRLTGAEIVERFARARGVRDSDYRDELVARFNAEMDRPVKALSKGNRQKIGLILAFMHRPELVVLDEPTSGLDPLLQDEFAALVEETVVSGSTVFLSSHDLDEVQRLVHELAIIKQGQVIVVDTVDGLRRRSPRTIELRFPRPVDGAEFADLDGVQVTSAGSDRVVLSVRGSVTPALAAAVPLEPVDIVARPADLDELFRAFYSEEPSHAV